MLIDPELRCPVTGLELREIPLTEAERRTGHLHSRVGGAPRTYTTVMMRSDGQAAYPVVGGVPILLTPEVLAPTVPVFDLKDVRWAEAYEEMAFYNRSAEAGEASAKRAAAKVEAARRPGSWPQGLLDAPYDAASQLGVFQYLGRPDNKELLQLGGHGSHALKMLAAGAAKAWLITPMLSEAQYGLKLAKLAGLEDRFSAAVGIAEQVPLLDGIFDGIYTGGCLHHMVTQFAGPEIRRLLKPGGRFGAVEPWQTSLHRYGTRVIGKREANAHCRPLTAERLESIRAAFPSMQIEYHGPVLRYAALAVQKFTKRTMTPQTGLRITAIDDRLPLPGRMGGSIAVLAER